jgi:hypothetical protein
MKRGAAPAATVTTANKRLDEDRSLTGLGTTPDIPSLLPEQMQASFQGR